jgi:hypothetical protein
MSVRSWSVVVVGSLIRFALFYTNFSPSFQRRVEVSTPLNSWVNGGLKIYILY